MISPNASSSPPSSVLADKTIRLKRAESPTVAGGTEEIQNLTLSLNAKIGELVATVKRWYDGDYGTSPGEDRTEARCYQDFASVALERIPSSFLVRVFDRLASGNCEQSAVSCIQGSRREKPGKGPLEEAIEANDEKEVARLRNYLAVVESASNPSRQSLSFIERWREEFAGAFRVVLPPVTRGDPAKAAADKWVDIIVDDAAQYLRHHVKLVQEWQTKEGERVKELQAFTESKIGVAFLEARSRFFPEGIPRDRKARFAIYSNPELCAWRKPKTPFKSGSTEAALMEGNPELVLLRDTNTTYRRLTKPFTRPTWTPVSTENLRWPFIPAALFDQRQGLLPTKDGFSVCIPVPPRVEPRSGISP